MKKIIFKNESGNVASKKVNNLAATSNEQQNVQKPDYKAMFVHKTDFTASKGKPVSIREEHHECFWKILHVIGKQNVTMAEYIDNILTSHFKKYEKAIKGSYRKNFKSYCIDIASNIENFFTGLDDEQENVYETDYKEKFVHNSDFVASLGKRVSIRKEYHARIRKIVNIIGKDKVTISEYLDNVVTEHLKTFEEAIKESYSKNLSLYYI